MRGDRWESQGPWPGEWTGGPHWNAHVGILLIQMFVPLLQDVVRVTDLLPDVHGLGRRGANPCPTLPWASWFCPHHLGQGLRDLAFLAGWGEANGDRTLKELDWRPTFTTDLHPAAAEVWGGGRAGCHTAFCHTGPEGPLLLAAVAAPHRLAGGFSISVSPFLRRAPPPLIALSVKWVW